MLIFIPRDSFEDDNHKITDHLSQRKLSMSS